jgi:hypothetical protein
MREEKGTHATVRLCQQPRLKHSETILHTRLDVHRAQQPVLRAPQRHLSGR